MESLQGTHGGDAVDLGDGGQSFGRTQDQRELPESAGGDAIVEVVDQWHYGYNDGPDIAELIVFYAGAQGQPITSNR